MINNVYYYQCCDCNFPLNVYVCTSDTVMQTGCSDSNPDCTATGGGGGGGGPVDDVARFSVEGSLNRSSLAERGLAAPLPVDVELTFPNAEYDLDYAGPNAYFTLTVHGRQRYVRVVRATIPPPRGLAILTDPADLKSAQPIGTLDLRIGQECVLPLGAATRPMEPVGKVAPGALILMARPSGKADAPAFLVILVHD